MINENKQIPLHKQSRNQFDSWASNLYGLPYPIYFYFYSKQALPDEKDSMVIGNCPSLLSVQFCPYLTHKDFNISPMLYDSARFGSVAPDRPQLDVSPGVFRINSIEADSRVKILGAKPTYPRIDNQIGGTRYWKNESKLFNYPYSFSVLTDGISPPLQVKPHLVGSDVMTIKVRTTLSDRCGYGIFVDGYKGDKGGAMEAVVSGDIHELPCSSSAYNQWYASSKNSTAQAVNAQVQNSFLSSAQASASAGLANSQSTLNQMMGVGSAMVNGLTGGGLLNGAMGVGSAMMQGGMQRQTNNQQNRFAQQQAGLNKKNAIQGAMAQTKDLNNTPNTMVSMGSDFIYGFNKQGSALKLFRYGLTTEFAVKLADYFALYGYKQNRMMNLRENMRTRNYYNYIKTIGANITPKGNVSKSDLDVLRNIFDNGTTIWHVGREGVNVHDYSMDNYEVIG